MDHGSWRTSGSLGDGHGHSGRRRSYHSGGMPRQDWHQPRRRALSLGNEPHGVSLPHGGARPKTRRSRSSGRHSHYSQHRPSLSMDQQLRITGMLRSHSPTRRTRRLSHFENPHKKENFEFNPGRSHVRDSMADTREGFKFAPKKKEKKKYDLYPGEPSHITARKPQYHHPFIGPIGREDENYRHQLHALNQPHERHRQIRDRETKRLSNIAARKRAQRRKEKLDRSVQPFATEMMGRDETGKDLEEFANFMYQHMSEHVRLELIDRGFSDEVDDPVWFRRVVIHALSLPRQYNLWTEWYNYAFFFWLDRRLKEFLAMHKQPRKISESQKAYKLRGLHHLRQIERFRSYLQPMLTHPHMEFNPEFLQRDVPAIVGYARRRLHECNAKWQAKGENQPDPTRM